MSDDKYNSNGMKVLKEMQSKIKEGLIPSKIFYDPDIFNIEQNKIFDKAWMFLGHETEIPNPGDYVVRYIGQNNLIVIRDEGGEVNVFFNSCMHRGMQVCNVDMGNTSHFRCPYHGWTYKNNGNLAGVPFGKALYCDQELDKKQWGLRHVPQSDTYCGLIFACLDPEAESLDEYLGDFKWYLDIYLKKSETGLEVIGSPNRWVIDMDWKLGSENFIGDAYHLASTHKSAFEALFQKSGNINSPSKGIQIFAGSGGVQLSEVPLETYFGYPEFIVESAKKSFSPEQLELFKNYHQSAGTLFPNLSFLVAKGKGKKDDPPVPFFLIRLWHPLDTGKIELWSWCLVEKDAPQWYKESSYRNYAITFGPAGTFEQDDSENLASITKVAKGSLASNHYLNYRMGLSGIKPLTDFPGPGIAIPSAFHEGNQRAFYTKYIEYMSKEKVKETIL